MHLPPGFRFHPTDVELVLYYLKRKIMARKLHYEAIAEVNIYKYSPWDLPDKSCLRSKDLEWFFFCPREKKYASGARVKRATENGYWKTTGKDRNIYSNEEPVGAVKTLIFHLGHAPHGERTNWVIHEYRILDNKLREAGVQDSYVLCKVFEKNGLGPRNGAQYGAPFNEDDWADDDDGDVSKNHAISMEAEGPSQTVLMPDKEQSLPLGSGFFDSGNGPFPLVEGGLSSSAVAPTSMVDANETDDEIVHLLALFADDGDGMFSLFDDDGTLLPNGNGLNQDNLSGNGNTKLLPSIEGLDVYNGLPDLDSCPTMNEGRFNFSGSQNTDYHLNMLPEDNSNYIELLDLVPSMDCSDGLTGTHSRLCQASATYSHENMQQLHSGTRFAGMGHYVSSNISEGDNSLDVIQMPDHQLYHGENASYNLDFLLEQLDNEVYSSQNMERGRSADNC